MPSLSSRFRYKFASGIRHCVPRLGLPLHLQTWVIDRMTPDPWLKSLAYQQCLADRIIKRHGAVIQKGPFATMKYLSDADDGCLIPKLLGCYEEELSPSIEQLIQGGYDRVIDVGCASGYFLSGLTFRQPRAEAFGFDTDPLARNRCAQVVALNNLGARTTLGGYCTSSELESLIRGRTILVIDCEGAEYELLDPAKSPSLGKCDIVVEVHDFINPQISPALHSRFNVSHSIEKLTSRTRSPDPALYPALNVLPREHWQAALDERRPQTMEWLILRAHRNASAP